MRVVCYYADETGCGHFRIFYPGEALNHSGQARVEFSQQLQLRLTNTTPPRVAGAAPIDADVVILQRPLLGLLADAIPHIQAQGVAVIVEIDDDFSRLHANHPVFRAAHPRVNKASNWQHLQRACGLADLVTVTTPALAERYGPHGHAIVLPNRVPASMLDITAERDGRTVGWAGFTISHVGDLTVTHGGVAQALNATGGRFLNIGNGDQVQQQLGLADEPNITGPVPFPDYPQALAQLDIGIAPLADNAFNHAKSALKILEYGALGIPCVASPRPDYQRLANEGIATIAQDRGRDWCRKLTQLITSPQLRAEQADHARAVIRERHTYETESWRWAEAWQEAITRRHHTPAKAAA